MSRRRSAFVLGVVAAMGLATAGCADQSAAIRVGDETVSEQELTDEMTALRDNELALQLITAATRADIAGEMGDDSYVQPFVGYLVQQRVTRILIGQLAEQEGVEASESDLDEMRGNIEGEFENAGGDVADLPDGFLDQLVEDLTIQQVLQGQLDQDELFDKLIELAEGTEVDLSSRFGTWDHDAFVAGLQGQQTGRGPVTPPAAPAPAPGSDTGTDLGLPAG